MSEYSSKFEDHSEAGVDVIAKPTLETITSAVEMPIQTKEQIKSKKLPPPKFDPYAPVLRPGTILIISRWKEAQTK